MRVKIVDSVADRADHAGPGNLCLQIIPFIRRTSTILEFEKK